METLSEKKWVERTIEDIFTVEPGKRLTNANKIDGNRPFIGASDNTNGITGFVGNANNSLDSNVLGVNYNGAPCIAFYHPYECIFTDDVKRFHLIDCLNSEHQMLFFKTIIYQQRIKYSYGYKFNEKRMLRQKIMIPVTNDNKIDYVFMSQYIAKQKEIIINKYIKYLKLNILNIGEYINILGLDKVKWKSFSILSLLGKSTNSKAYHFTDLTEVKDYGIPYITRTALNNGLFAMVSSNTDYKINPKHSISFGAESAKYFYQPYEYITGNKTYFYSPGNFNEYVMMFITQSLNKAVEGGGFGYGMGLTGNRSDRLKVLLPVNSEGEPDYEYMEQYIKNMMLKKYNQYLNYLNKKQETQSI